MKLLPVYLNCVLKSDVLLPGADVSLDDRAYLRQLISCMDVAETHVFFYPRLLPLVSANAHTRTITHALTNVLVTCAFIADLRYVKYDLVSSFRFSCESVEKWAANSFFFSWYHMLE